MIENIHWLGHDSFKISGSRTIYIDPWQLEGEHEKADLILLTHEHDDHFSPKDIERLRGKNTIVVGSAQVWKKMNSVKILLPGQSGRFHQITVNAVHAYNVNKFREPGTVYHPRDDQKVGFVIEMDGSRIYHAGDTDLIPEMDNLKNISIALLPVSGTYVMTAQEAALATGVINPQLAVPMHYGSIVGSEEDAQRFKSLCDCPVKILQKE